MTLYKMCILLIESLPALSVPTCQANFISLYVRNTPLPPSNLFLADLPIRISALLKNPQGLPYQLRFAFGS